MKVSEAVRVDAPAVSAGEASLRGADWRFVLPSPPNGRYRHVALIGGSAALASRLTAEGIADLVTPGPVEPGSADAVVVLRSGSVGTSLRAAAHMTSRDGALYYEVDRTGAAKMGRTAAPVRVLSDEGLRHFGTYWIRPGFEVRRLYLPVDRPAAVRWYIRTSQEAPTATELARRTVQLWASRLGEPVLRLLMRRYAITAVGPDTGARPPSVLDSSALPSELRDPLVRPVIVANGDDEWGRVVLLPFGPGEDRPRGVVKFSRLAARNNFAEDEQKALATLGKVLGGDGDSALPRPLGLTRWGEITLSAETYVPGRAMSTIISRWGASSRAKAEAFRTAANWLMNFNADHPAEVRVWSEVEHGEWIEEPLLEYLRVCEPGPEVEALVADVTRAAREMIGWKLPLVWCHYAFGPWNLLTNDDGIGVIDWEGFWRDLPMTDLLYFANAWHEASRGGATDELAEFERLFCRPPVTGSLESVVQDGIAAYLKRMNVPGVLYPVALTLLWANRSISIAKRRREAVDAGVDVRMEYMRVLAENREFLVTRFAGPGRSAGEAP